MNYPAFTFSAILPLNDLHVPEYAQVIIEAVRGVEDQAIAVTLSCQAYLARLNVQVRLN